MGRLPSRPRRATAHPAPLRAGALAVAALLALVVLLTGCSGDESDQSETTTTTAAPTTTTTTEPPLEAGTQKEPLYFVPEVGQCLDKRKVPGADNTKQVDTILLLDCQLPHQYEIFATLEYPIAEDADIEWPGDEAVRNFARASCPATFEAYVGKDYETSTFEIGHLLPPEDNFLSNQVIGCYVYDPTQDTVVEGRTVQGRTSGTAQGSAR